MSIRDDLQNLMNSYAAAYQAGDATACAAFFSPDAKLYSPFGPPACGRAAIEALHEDWTQEDWTQAGGSGKRLFVIDAGRSGDLAWCLASFSEGQLTGHGTSLNVLERQAEGNWLIGICSLNNGEPEPTA